MILDATAGNRVIWRLKNPPNVIFLDVETRLPRKPDIYADNRLMPFRNEVFDMIIFDPPFSWGEEFGVYNRYVNEKRRIEESKGTKPFTYYGADKYKSRGELISAIYKTQVELSRVLKSDGVLMLKWGEVDIPLTNVLTVFQGWMEMMRLYIDDPSQTAGKTQTYWILLCKKNGGIKQTDLTNMLSAMASPPTALSDSPSCPQPHPTPRQHQLFEYQ